MGDASVDVEVVHISQDPEVILRMSEKHTVEPSVKPILMIISVSKNTKNAYSRYSHRQRAGWNKTHI